MGSMESMESMGVYGVHVVHGPPRNALESKESMMFTESMDPMESMDMFCGI